MNDIRRGRGRGRQRGGGRHHHHQQQQPQYRSEESSWTVKQSSDQQKLTEFDDDNQIPFHAESVSQNPSSSKPSFRGTDGCGRRGRRGRNRSHGKGGLVGDRGVVNVEFGEVLEVVEIEAGKREEEERVVMEEEKVGEESIEECCELGNDEDVMLRRLKELRLGYREAELTEEEFSVNDQLQEDELLAMESIYGENVVKLQRLGGMQTFQVRISIELPNEFSVSAKFTSSVAGPEDESYPFKVRYLPPIILTCLLPRSYPSHLPPTFIITVKWLDSAKIAALCSMLDTIWKEQSGQEVIYHWAEWLHSSSLPYLGIEKDLVLEHLEVCPSEDKRAVSGITSSDIDIHFLKNYNDEQCHENFLHSAHQCCICFNEYPGTEFAKLPCQHFFCWACLKTYSDISVKEGTVNKLQCPISKCGGMIPPEFLKKLLGKEDFERWESLTLQKTLDSMSDVIYCPRCETACIVDEDDFAQCFKCFYSFCSLCLDKRHVGVRCMTPEMKLQILEERQNSTKLGEDQKRKERDMINEILSVKEILRVAKQCPSCNMAISRTEGCNKMVCNNCQGFFCYRCGKSIDGYDHFREGSCQLFTEQMVQEWEERLNDRQLVGQVRLEANRGRAHACPNCRQLNVKRHQVGNNNHMFCWACQIHYCYLCKNLVRRSAEHYKPKGCKQHTEG